VDRVALLADGALKAIGSPREVLTGAALEDAYGIRVRVVKDGTAPIIVPEPP
jgi:ABC-type cobalamin/Fe3+-siderophores transport system ATPase subunit